MSARGLCTILHGAFTPTEAHKFHNVTSQMALITDIQVFMLVKQTAKHPQLNIFPLYIPLTHSTVDSLDIALDFCFSWQKATCYSL